MPQYLIHILRHLDVASDPKCRKSRTIKVAECGCTFWTVLSRCPFSYEALIA